MASALDRVFFRAFIGPKPVSSDDPDLYGKWDWATSIGSGYTAPPYIGAMALTATLASGSTSGFTKSGVTLPAEAGVWIGPNGSGQGWEYVAYKTSHAGANSLLRNTQEPHNGTHTSGAPVYFWFPLDMNDGTAQYTAEMSDNMASITYTLSLSGVRAPSHVLKPEHMVLIMYTTEPDAIEADWLIFAVGFIEKISMSNDGRGLAQWTLDMNSASRLYQVSSVPNLRIGPLDVALEASVDASSTLGAAWKLSLPQRHQVDIEYIPETDLIDLQASFGPENVVDGNENTMWVSDGWVGDPANYANSAGRNAWASLFMYPPPNALFGSRYIEVINHDGLDISWFWIYSKYSYPGGTRGHWINGGDPDTFADHAGIPTGSEGFTNVEDRIVIAENGEMFKKLFPSAKPKYFLDIAPLSGGLDIEMVRRLWWEGGAIFMAWQAGVGGVGSGYLIHWGDVTYSELETAWETQGSVDIDPLPASNLYIPLTNAKPGMVLRREMQTGDAEWAFTWDYLHHPGYVINTDVNDGDFADWIKVRLPEMNHVLALDIDLGATTVYLQDSQGAPNVEGISQHGTGGAIIIDDEVITFTGKVYDTGALTGCTVAQLHKAGTRAYVRWKTPWYGIANASIPGTTFDKPFQDKLFDLATSAYPLSKLKWGRGYYSNGDPRFPYINSFVWDFSPYDDARTPYDDSHEIDYVGEYTVDASGWFGATGEQIQLPNASIDLTTAYFNDNDDGFRPRTLLMRIREMANSVGTPVVVDRPRLSYIKAEVDRRYFNPDTWIDPGSGMNNSLLVHTMMDLSGQWASITSTYSTAGDPDPLARSWGVTDRGTAWQVAVDMADYGGSIIDCRRNGRIRIMLNRYLYLSAHEIDRSFTAADVTSVEVVNIRPAEVGQIRLKWENGQTKASGVVVWPETVRKGGTVIEMGPMLAEDATMAQIIVFNLYLTKRFPYNVFVELSSSQIDVEVGEIHQLDYPFVYQESPIRKYLLVETVQQEIADGVLKTAIGYREILRETA